MTPAIATQDEDLLIISEDTADTSNDIDFSFSFGDEISTPSAVGAPEMLQTSTPTLETPVEAPASLGDFSLDVFSQDSQLSEPSVAIENSVSNVSKPDITLSLENNTVALENSPIVSVEENNISRGEVIEASSLQASAEVSVPQAEVAQSEAVTELDSQVSQAANESTAESLNDILSATIAKLALRAETISSESSGKSAQIADIQAQIKALEEQVSTLEGEISLLTAESDKISKNIEALEEMKLDPVKEHNARRVAKK